jgi:nitrate reductase NapAB chaperone NapD
MATTVYETTDLTLMDDTKIKMRPLKISLLREFMSKFDTITEVATSNEKSMDVLVDCVQIAMKQYAVELSEDRAKLEDVVDLNMVYKIIEVASGIKLDAEGNGIAATDLAGKN